MKNLVLCSSLFVFAALALFTVPQASAQSEADYKIPYTNIWVNIYGNNGIKQIIEKLTRSNIRSGLKRHEFSINVYCKYVGKVIPADIDTLARNRQYEQLINTAVRSCGSLESVQFQVEAVR